MADFYTNPPSLEGGPVIRSLIDFDFYDLTMGNVIHQDYADVDTVFEFINRHTSFPLADVVEEGDLREELDHVTTVRTRNTDLYYLRGMDVYGDRLFPESFLQHFKDLRMRGYALRRIGNQYSIRFLGKWGNAMNWELYGLPIITQLISREVERHMTEPERREFYRRAAKKLDEKISRILANPRIRIADFGHRRRHSFPWHKYVVGRCKERLGRQFVGTSNVWMAFHHDLVPTGTIAHQMTMIPTALARPEGPEAMRAVQYQVTKRWGEIYPYALRILLPDTYGSAQFFKNMPKELAEWVAHNYRGSRGDSGELIDGGIETADWFRHYGANPKEKLYLPSDGLDVELIEDIDAHLNGVIDLSYGPGSFFTNDFRGCHPRGHEEAVIRGKHLGITWEEVVSPHSLVVKPVLANNQPCVKLSNNPNKATGAAHAVEQDKQTFGAEGMVAQDVLV